LRGNVNKIPLFEGDKGGGTEENIFFHKLQLEILVVIFKEIWQ